MKNTNEELLRKLKNTVDRKEIRELKNLIVTNNINCVHSRINKIFSNPYAICDLYNITYDDLVQEGYLAVLKAIDKFDIDKGYAFITYLYPVITTSILQYIRKSDLKINIVSLDKESSNIEDDSICLLDLIEDPNSDIDKFIEMHDTLYFLSKVLNRLSYNDIKFIDLYYYKNLTMRESAKKMGYASGSRFLSKIKRLGKLISDLNMDIGVNMNKFSIVDEDSYISDNLKQIMSGRYSKNMDDYY